MAGRPRGRRVARRARAGAATRPTSCRRSWPPSDLREAVVLERTREARRGTDDFSLLGRDAQPGPCLLVVDNCEHLIDAAAALVDGPPGRLPARCGCWPPAANRWASTGSRSAPFRRWAPAAGDGRARRGHVVAAVQLFVDRARAVRAGLRRSTTSTVAPVVEIVRRLDGLPLAIELAAARLRVLPVAEIADRLVRPVPAADRWPPHRAPPPPDAAGRRRVELGPAHRRRAAAGRTARRLPRRVDDGERHRGLRRRPPRRRRRPHPARLARSTSRC